MKNTNRLTILAIATAPLGCDLWGDGGDIPPQPISTSGPMDPDPEREPDAADDGATEGEGPGGSVDDHPCDTIGVAFGVTLSQRSPHVPLVDPTAETYSTFEFDGFDWYMFGDPFGWKAQFLRILDQYDPAELAGDQYITHATDQEVPEGAGVYAQVQDCKFMGSCSWEINGMAATFVDLAGPTGLIYSESPDVPRYEHAGLTYWNLSWWIVGDSAFWGRAVAIENGGFIAGSFEDNWGDMTASGLAGADGDWSVVPVVGWCA